MILMKKGSELTLIVGHYPCTSYSQCTPDGLKGHQGISVYYDVEVAVDYHVLKYQ